MAFFVRLALAGFVSFTPSANALAGNHGPIPQYVIISFDGAHDLAQWERSRRLAAKTGARFTYFLSCVFLLSRDTRSEYKAPGSAVGRSQVGFAQSKDEVAGRLDQIRAAAEEGHEIASHACGHFDGKDWSKDDWLDEFSSFRRILADAYTINEIEKEPAGWRDFAATAISGFRAPYLSTGPGLFDALESAGFAYDASSVSREPVAPHHEGGIRHFSLPQIPEGPKQRSVIAMDYNLFVRHSGGVERPDDARVFEERTLEAFKAAFENQYKEERVPLQLGFHFTLMNDGAYWRALEQFAEDVCGMADVVCTSYADYLKRTSSPAGGDVQAPGG